jgi:hypothetical protein
MVYSRGGVVGRLKGRRSRGGSTSAEASSKSSGAGGGGEGQGLLKCYCQIVEVLLLKQMKVLLPI